MKVVPVLGLIILTAKTPLAEPPPSEYITTYEDKFVPPPPSSSNLGSLPTAYAGSRPESGFPSTDYGLPSSFPPSELFKSINQLQSQNKHTKAIFASPNRKSPSSMFGTPPSSFGSATFSYGGSTSLHSGHSDSGYSSGNHYDEDDQSEPANYEFSYSVYDPESGNDFGHHETRHGDGTWGSYMVLLPDGRKQIVEYQADQYGYRPVIRYEDAHQNIGNGHNGYASDGSY